MDDLNSLSSRVSFDSMEAAITGGWSPDEPEILHRYLALVNKVAQQAPGRTEKTLLYYRAANTLLETICDSCLPRHWRSQCLDLIYQPIFSLQKLAIDESERHRLRLYCCELNTLANYFLV